MDIIGSYGYSGQTLTNLDADKFCYISGAGIVIVDASGPKDIIWRHEHGVSTIASHIQHLGSKWLAIAAKSAGIPIEVMDIGQQRVVFTIKNPTNVSIIDLNFSRDATRLVGLTEVTEHKVILWNVTTREVLHEFPIKDPVSKCLFNPCNPSMISLTDNESIFMGLYTEIQGRFDLKLTSYDFLQDHENNLETTAVAEDNQRISDVLPLSYSNPVGFLSWSSLDVLFICTNQGYLLELNVISKILVVVGNILYAQNIKSHPSCAVLTADYLMIGTLDGTIQWFQRKLIFAFITRAKSLQPIEAGKLKPVKMAKLQRNRTSLTSLCTMRANPIYTSILCGASDGTIHSVGIDLLDTGLVEEEDLGESDDPIAALLSSLPNMPEIIVTEPFMELQVGAVLCVKNLYIQVYKMNDEGNPTNENTGTLLLFITGSHTGAVTFWRPPTATEFDPASTALGIRKSALRKPDVLHRAHIKNGVSGPTGVTSLEIMSVVCKPGGRLLGVGTSDGWFELWLVEAFQSEDEEGEGDDEEGLSCIKVTMVMRRHMFETPVSLISSCDTKPIVVVGSTASDKMYLLSFNQNNTFVQVANVFSIFAENMTADLVGMPRCCCWQKQTLWVMTDKGMFISIKDMSEKISVEGQATNIGYMATSIKSMGAGLLSPTGVFLLSDEISSQVHVSSTLPGDAVTASSSFLSHFDHGSSVLCICRSPSGTLLATGCVDGSVCLWRCSLQSGKADVSLVNMYRIHHSPVLVIEFAVESNLLFSCAADGSVFVVSVDKRHLQKKDPRPPAAKMNDEMVRDAAIVEEGNSMTSRLWQDVHREQLVYTLKEKYVTSIKHVGEAVLTLRNKLDKMLRHNEDCDELERMGTDEFVVDTRTMQRLLEQNDGQVSTLREQYEHDCRKNELIASRLRQVCWDMNESNSKCLLPIQEDLIEALSIWSFPIKKYTDADFIKLEKVKRLRALEMKAQSGDSKLGLIQLMPAISEDAHSGSTRAAWVTAIDGSPVDATWLVNDGARWPRADIMGMLELKDKTEADGRVGITGLKEGLAPVAAAVTVGGGEEEEETNVAENDINVEDIDFKNIFNLLYPPQAVRTQVQKRTQIMLLKEVCKQVRGFFNKKFEKLCREKEDVMGKLDSFNSRIREIHSELQIEEHIFKPSLRDVEIAGSAIVVNDAELVNRPYLSAASQQKRQREEEERRRREEENKEDDSKERALVDMMNNTLEVKRDVFAEASALQRPEWMDSTVPELMTEVQRKEVEEFEAKFKLLQEEQARYRTQLQNDKRIIVDEVKKLYSEFDDKLKHLAEERIFTEREILSHEMYMSRLAMSMASHDQLRRELADAEKSIENANAVYKKKQQVVTDFKLDVEMAASNLKQKEAELAALKKSFNADLKNKSNREASNNFDPDTFKELKKWFDNKRGHADYDGYDGNDMTASEMTTFGFSTERKSSSMSRSARSSKLKSKRNKTSRQNRSKNAGGKSRMGASRQGVSARASQGPTGSRMGVYQQAAQDLKDQQDEVPSAILRDPFHDIVVKLEKDALRDEDNKPSLEDIDIDKAVIPGLLGAEIRTVWEAMNNLRKAYWEKDIEATAARAVHKALDVKLTELSVDESIASQSRRTLISQREGILSSIASLNQNLQCLVALRQGQDEVDRDVVVTDYSDAILIPALVVNRYNSRIKELGQDKVSVLNDIRRRRRKINILTWEARHKEMEVRDQEAYYWEVHGFKVTRDMQQVIQEVDQGTSKAKDPSNKSTLSGSPRKDVVGTFKESSFRTDKITKDNQILKRLLKLRAEENHQLEKRIDDLCVQIDDRKQVLHSRCDARGEDASPAVMAMKRMKKVVTRRRLVDMSTLQSQELGYLRQELEKMRDKTFPSFVKAFRSRVHTNPDDLLTR